jgi:type VI secretion system protein ImpF
MAELTTTERLQPSLLDRLTDDFPHIKQESRDKRVMSMRQLRTAVLRDLAFLLNTPAKPRFEDLHQFPRVARSVINYGIPDFTGMTTSGITPTQMERVVQRSIQEFEPRIVGDSLKVNAVASKETWGNSADQKFEFEITGDYCPLPMPEALFLRTEVDLETGHCEVKEKP